MKVLTLIMGFALIICMGALICIMRNQTIYMERQLQYLSGQKVTSQQVNYLYDILSQYKVDEVLLTK